MQAVLAAAALALSGSSGANAGRAGELGQDSSPEKTLTIVATGAGTDVTASTHNALYEALCEALGAIVSAEIVLEDDALREKIVVYTDGFIEDYEVLDQTEVDGIHTTTVAAQVSITSLGAELRNWGVDTTKVDGKVLAARARIKTASQAARARLVHHALFQLNGIVQAELGGGWEMVDSDANAALLSVPFHYWVDVDAYQAWHDKFIPWFERMAANHPETRRLIWSLGGDLDPEWEGRRLNPSYQEERSQFIRNRDLYSAENNTSKMNKLVTLWVDDPIGRGLRQYCFDFGSNPWVASPGQAYRDYFGHQPFGSPLGHSWHLRTSWPEILNPSPGTLSGWEENAPHVALTLMDRDGTPCASLREVVPTVWSRREASPSIVIWPIPVFKDADAFNAAKGELFYKDLKRLLNGERFQFSAEFRFTLPLAELSKVSRLQLEILWPE